MNDDAPATRKDINEVLQVMRDFMQQTDERFNQNEALLRDLRQDVVDLKSSHNKLISTIDTFIGRIDSYESEQVARDGQFERLLTWARKVSEKTGIPLENL
jgi:hemerythrin